MPNIPANISNIIDEFVKNVNELLGNRIKKNNTIWFLC